MKQQLFLIAGMVFVFFLLFPTEKTHADALGLQSGLYDITFDFLDDTYDGGGTITIGTASVIAFHTTLGPITTLDCFFCPPGAGSPDFVSTNDGNTFVITHRGTAQLTMNTGGTANFICFIASVACTPATDTDGIWDATFVRAIDEPSTLFLLGIGLILLAAWRRRKTA